MKLTALFLLAGFLQLSAAGLSQNVTISVRQAPLQQVLASITRQTGFGFLYRSTQLSQANTVTIDVKDTELRTALDEIFKDQPFRYEIANKTIVVTAKKSQVSTNEAANPVLAAAPAPVHGRVVNEKGEPVAGVSISIKGGKVIGVTDDNGEFALNNVPPNAVLVFSAVSIEAMEIKFDGQSNINVAIRSRVSILDDLQVIAYGTTTKRLNTGNVSTVKGEDIAKQPVNNPLLALEGRVPGLLISQNSGVAGGGITVRLQGQNSLNRGSDPLYVIDGVPYLSQLLPNISGITGILGPNGNTNSVYAPGGGGNPLSFINPADIESIDVLKDADATAIYGSRAANGAILITTKKGKIGKTKVNINVQQGWGKVTRKLDLLNTQQYLQMRHEALNNDVIPIGPNDYDINGFWDSTRYTDWQKVLIGGTAKYTDAEAAISGGCANTSYLIASGYHKETTVFPGDLADKKGTLHFNVNSVSTNQKFRIQLSGNYVADDNQLVATDLTNFALKLPPNAPALYNADGTLNWALLPNGNSTWYNPLAYLYQKYSYKTKNLISNAILSYQILPGLSLKSSFGYTDLKTNETNVFPSIANAPEVRATTTRFSVFLNSSTNSWIAEPQITYNHSLGKGVVDAIIGTTVMQNNSEMNRIIGRGFNSDLVMEDIRSASTLQVQNSIISKYRYNALFGRINYNWQNRYIVNLTARRDGSSRFGAENLFHNFGSVGGAWIFTNETFMKNLKIVSFGKLRASYGTTGNDQIGDYQFINLYNPYSVPVAYQGTTSLAPAGLPNSHLQWEETKKFQIGLELGLFSDRIFINGNYYNNSSSNLLLGYALPSFTGNSDIQLNFPATVRNTGWEFSITTKNIENKQFGWSSTLNLTIPKNKLASFPNLASSTFSSIYVVGEPITLNRVFPSKGIDPTTGLLLFANASGGVTSAPGFATDRTAIVNTDPKFYGGLQNTFHYGNFSLDFLVEFSKKISSNHLFPFSPGIFYANNSGSLIGNQPAFVMNRWQKPGDVADFQKFTSSFSSPAYNSYSLEGFSTASYLEGSYVRLKNLSVSWNLPDKWIQKAHLQNARVYAQGQNLFTITKYKGLDPETQTLLRLPPLRVITIGVQVVL